MLTSMLGSDVEFNPVYHPLDSVGNLRLTSRCVGWRRGCAAPVNTARGKAVANPPIGRSNRNRDSKSSLLKKFTRKGHKLPDQKAMGSVEGRSLFVSAKVGNLMSVRISFGSESLCVTDWSSSSLGKNSKPESNRQISQELLVSLLQISGNAGRLIGVKQNRSPYCVSETTEQLTISISWHDGQSSLRSLVIVSRLAFSQSAPCLQSHRSSVIGMKRRREIAKGLSIALAYKLFHTHPALPLRRLKGASYNRFIRNVQPYVLALAHLLECYRDELARCALPTNPKASHPIPCVDLKQSILSSRYDEETAYRICTLYDMLKRILDHDLDNHGNSHQSSNMFDLHDVHRHNHTVSLNIFVFGGLEAVKDLLLEPDPGCYSSIIDDHFAKACPDARPPPHRHSLPPSTLRRLDRPDIRKICQLLPDHPHRIPNLHRLRFAEFPAPRGWRKRGLDRFYRHLVSHKGKMPTLVLEG